jgi:AAA+ superfamily predicted ATPase
MKTIKLFLTALLCFNVATQITADPVYVKGEAVCGEYVWSNEQQAWVPKNQPKYKQTYLKRAWKKYKALDYRYYISDTAFAIAATILSISLNFKMMEHLTSPNKFEVTNPEAQTATFDSIFGAEKAKKAMMKYLRYVQNPDSFIAVNAEPSIGCILYGPPGTGKTEIARAMAKEAGLPFLALNGADFNTKYVGSGPGYITAIKNFIKESNSPCVVFIDEADSAFGKPNGYDGLSCLYATTNKFKSLLDGFDIKDPKKSAFFVLATNHIDKIDNAIRGRRLTEIYVGPPSKEQTLAMLKNKLLKGNKLTIAVDLDKAIDRFYVENITTGATVKELNRTIRNNLAEANSTVVTQEVFDQAMRDMQTTTA